MTYVVATDVECRWCRRQHGYVTKGCMSLAVYVDWRTAQMVANRIEGMVQRVDLKELDPEVGCVVFLQKNGQPDPLYGQAKDKVPRR